MSISEKIKLLGRRAQNNMLEYRGGVIEISGVSNILHLNHQTVNYKRNESELIAININGCYKYPIWQFDNGKVIKNLKDVLTKLSKSNDQWMQLRFFIGDNDYLLSNLPEYSNVIDALKHGYIQEVLKAVSVYFKHGAV